MSFDPNKQDWEPVILQKKRTDKDIIKSGGGTVVKKNVSNSNSNKVDNGKSANDFDPEHIKKPPTSNIEMGKAIERGRMAKKIIKNGEEKSMTQADLDRICNLPPNTVKNYENANSDTVVIPAHLLAIERALAIKIPRPHK
jgi:hypothetical protein